MAETEACPSTLNANGSGSKRIACRLPIEHPGRHVGMGAFWWHGNGETCPGCTLCAALAAQPSPASPDTEGGTDRGLR